MEVICTECDSTITSDNINVAKDTAYCQSCQSLSSLSGLLESADLPKYDVNRLPTGVTVNDKGYFWSIEASMRSKEAWILVPFTTVWSGFSLSAVYGTQIASGTFNSTVSLIGLPFLIGSIFLIAKCFLLLFGRVLITNDSGKGLIFVGIGALGRYRRFAWADIEVVGEEQNGKHYRLCLKGKKSIKFATGLNREKFFTVAQFVRSKLRR